MDSVELIRLLLAIEQRSVRNAAGLPKRETEKEIWEGIVFSVAGKRLVVSLRELVEILDYPAQVTRVPGAVAWMRGIANVRGSLLPLIDLQRFLGGPATQVGRRNRVLVFRYEGNQYGLLVGETVGLRHFSEENRSGQRETGGRLREYVQFGFEQDGAHWPVFSVQALADNPVFQNAAR